MLAAYCVAASAALAAPLLLIRVLPLRRMAAYGLSQVATLVLAAAVVYVFNSVISRRSPSEIGLTLDRRKLAEVPMGLLIGASLVTCSFVVMVLSGAIRIAYADQSAAVLRLVPIAMLIQALQVLSEELLYRTYLLAHLSERVGEFRACLYLAAAFGAFHLLGRGNTWIGLAGITLASVLLNVAYFLSDRNPWFTFAIHYGWNALGAHVLFSRRVFDISYARAWWLSGDGNPEGSIISAMVVFAAAGYALTLHRRLRPAR